MAGPPAVPRLGFPAGWAHRPWLRRRQPPELVDLHTENAGRDVDAVALGSDSCSLPGADAGQTEREGPDLHEIAGVGGVDHSHLARTARRRIEHILASEPDASPVRLHARRHEIAPVFVGTRLDAGRPLQVR